MIFQINNWNMALYHSFFITHIWVKIRPRANLAIMELFRPAYMLRGKRVKNDRKVVKLTLLLMLVNS